MNRIWTPIVALGLVCPSLCLAASADPPPVGPPTSVAFEKITLTRDFVAEAPAVADIDRDGHVDAVVGMYWYAGPDFKTRYTYFPEQIVPPEKYARHFMSEAYDISGDGYPDVLINEFPGQQTVWYENPGKDAVRSSTPWRKHTALAVTDNESPAFADLTGDGKPELACNNGGYFGYASPDPADPRKPWPFTPITPKGKWHKYTHGLGVGDVDGDGRMDLIEKDGWWQRPAEGSPSEAGQVWQQHRADFGSFHGGVQMYAYDVDGDGDNDVITVLHCHHFGMAWFEQSRGADGSVTWTRHTILGDKPADNEHGVCFSQAHALALVDIDDDGLKDLVTGKRFWAHGPKGDPDPSAPAVLYWFRLVRDGGKAAFIPHLVDADSGVGMQVATADFNKDSKPDILIVNKKGAFVFLQR